MHPTWYLRVPGRPRQLGRNQMVLDLSRVEVQEYLYDAISSILTYANIEYIKWDMNRPLTEVYTVRDTDEEFWQSETCHRYMLGVYSLQERLVTAFPNVLLENCASGGN
jgi:alpha-galactosidase